MPFRSRTAPALALAVLAAGAVAGCADKKADAAPVQTVPAQRQTIVVDVEATGVITPINAVEVRSKASGQITQLRVTTGTPVKEGDLLARIDPRDPQSRFDQARAAVNAAQINVQVARAQFERNQALSQQGVITAPEFETTRTAYAQAQSQLTSARTQLDLARIALEDVTIRAPSNGTVIARNVSQGQVITSSTNSPSGGTILLRIANLGTVYDSTLVNESDIGKVKPGQPATVTVDAYPGRTFRGIVEKIEPQATVQQSVTMFPVLIRLDNVDGALMPGMNSDVSILVEERPDVVAVPVDAIRQPREAVTAATALGLDPDKVREAMQAQGGAGRGGARGGQPGAGGDTPTTRADVPAAGGAARGAPNAGGGGAFAGDVAPTAAECDAVTKALAAKPAVRDRMAALRRDMQSGAADPREARTTMRALYDSAGVDPRVARACMRGGAEPAGAARAAGAGARGGFSGAAAGGGTGAAGASRRGRAERGVVFVKSGETYEPRMVTLGVSNYDVTEVVSGLKEGEQVALVSAAVLQQSRTEFQNRIRSRSSLPGMGGGAGGAGGAGGGGGGARGGAGGAGGGGGGGGGGRPGGA